MKCTIPFFLSLSPSLSPSFSLSLSLFLLSLMIPFSLSLSLPLLPFPLGRSQKKRKKKTHRFLSRRVLKFNPTPSSLSSSTPFSFVLLHLHEPWKPRWDPFGFARGGGRGDPVERVARKWARRREGGVRTRRRKDTTETALTSYLQSRPSQIARSTCTYSTLVYADM